MPTTKITGLGDVGVILDVPNFSLPDNAISFAQNVRAYHGRLRAFPKESLLRTSFADVQAIFCLDNRFGVSVNWPNVLICGNAYIQNITETTQTDITGGTIASSKLNDRWTVSSQGDLVSINPGLQSGTSSVPQLWDSNTGATPVYDMRWDNQAFQTWRDLNYAAYVMRSYRDVFIAMNIRFDTTTERNAVAWCDFLEEPDTHTDWVPRTTNNAGKVNLKQTPGAIIDGEVLRDDFIIYKQDATFRMTATESDPPFRFTRLPSYAPPMAPNCIAQVEDNHVVLNSRDVYLFDGNSFISVLDKRLREYWRDNMDQTYYKSSYAVHFQSENEVWCCRTQAGRLDFPNEAIVWNYRDNSLSIRDIAGPEGRMAGIAYGNILGAGNNPFLRFMGVQDSGVYNMAEDYANSNTCLAQREGLVLNDPESGIASTKRVFTLRRVSPYIKSNAGGIISVRVGASMYPNGPYTYEDSQQFIPASQRSLEFRSSGHFFAWEISSIDEDWELTDIEFEYEIAREGRG